MSEVYHNGYLHTNSSYFTEAEGFFNVKTKDYKEMFSAENIAKDYMDAIDYAESREIAFYQSLFPGVTDFDVFMAKLRELFENANKHANIRQALGRLSNASIKSKYKIKNNKQKYKYTIIIDNKDLMKDIKIESKGPNYSLEGGPYSLSFDDEVAGKIIQDVVNHIKGADPEWLEERYGSFNRAHTTRRGSSFTSKKINTANLQDWLNDEFDKCAKKEKEKWTKEIVNGLTLVKEAAGGGEIKEDETDLIPAETLPFNNYLPSEINKKIKEGDLEFLRAVQESRKQVRNFLLDRLDVKNDPVFMKAFNIAWNKLPTNFFFEGDSLVKSVLGNVSEFALDLSLTYARLLTGGKHGGPLGKVIGDIISNGRGQPRSDYEMLVMAGGKIESIGIQSKNVDESGYDKIEVHTDLGLMAPNLGDNITTSIANYKFNASIAAEVGNMRKFLDDYLNKMVWRGLNFNVKPGLIPEHTNTFYFLGGTKIIPVSHYMKHMGNPGGKKLLEKYKTKENITQPETTIFGLSKGKINDKQFESGEPELFLTYWHGRKPNWEPQPSNTSEFQNLLAGIRVESVLKFSSFLKVATKGNVGRYDFLT